MCMEYKIFILLVMIFCHIVDDYYLQGWLALGKRKKWWEKLELNNPEKYKYDYIMALFMHSFSWSFMIMLAPTLINKELFSLILFIANIIIHMFVDNLKANKMKINLVTDQFIHLLQVVFTWIILIQL